MRRTLPVMTAALLAMAAAPAALAAPPQAAEGGGAAPAPGEADDATRATARKIAEEGLSLFDSGKYAEALDRFVRAGSLVRAPTMELLAARSLVKLGRLVEASRRYEAAAGMTLAPGASDAFRKAQVDARKEREALAPRIPSLWLTLDAGAGAATVTLDGEPVPAERLGAPLPVDPGLHTVVVARDDTRATERVQLAEGEERRLSLRLAAPPAPVSKMKIAGVTGIALGGAGLVAGAVAGALAIGENSQLEKVCLSVSPASGLPACPESERGRLDGYNTLKAVTTASLVTGSVLLGAGALLVGLSPAAPASTSSAARAGGARISPWIGAGSAGIHVIF